MSDIIFASSHTSLTLFLVIYDWRSRTSLAPTWITILLNLRLALASTFKSVKMSGALAPGKQWTMVAGVSIFTFRTIESPITRALSSGFSVGASLSGENLFDALIGMEEQCFDPRLGRLTVTQLPCCLGSTGTKQCTGLPELVASKAVSTARPGVAIGRIPGGPLCPTHKLGRQTRLLFFFFLHTDNNVYVFKLPCD